MKGFLEQYGTAIFVLVLTSILIAFASPIGKTIKSEIAIKVKNTTSIVDKTIDSETNNTIYWFDTNYILDGTKYYDGSDISKYLTFDFYINGKLYSKNTYGVYEGFSYGTTYEIKNIRINDGYHLVSTSKPLSGIIDSNLSGVNDFCFTIESDKTN